MNFTELLTEVYELTGRADLVAKTKAAVKAATLKAHMTDFYSRDIAEIAVVAASADYIHQIDYITLVTNFRALKYLRKYDSVTTLAGAFLDVITPEEVLDSYGNEKSDVCYMAGRTLSVKSSTQEDNFILSCYVLPDVTEGSYSSWVAEQFPYVIVYEAARVVFKMVQDADQSNTYDRLGKEQLILMRETALTNLGY